MAKQKGSISVYDDLIRTIDEDFYDMLNETSDISDSYTTKLIKSLFQSCNDEALINDKGLNSMKSVLSELGGWPVLEDKYWSEKSFKWTDIIKKMREIGIDYNILFTIKYKKRQDDGSKRILTVIIITMHVLIQVVYSFCIICKCCKSEINTLILAVDF